MGRGRGGRGVGGDVLGGEKRGREAPDALGLNAQCSAALTFQVASHPAAVRPDLIAAYGSNIIATL